MGLAVLSGRMMAISLHLRQVASPCHSVSKGVVSPAASEAGERCATLQPLEAMSSSRCAFGVCVWNDRFVVCGGCFVGCVFFTSPFLLLSPEGRSGDF